MWPNVGEDENIGNYGYIAIWFYGYIGDISIDILTQNIGMSKLMKIMKISKKTLKNYIRCRNRHF